jgi:hypothetical protein
MLSPTYVLRALVSLSGLIALKTYVGDNMGVDYVEAKPFDIEATKVEMNP